jgi:two-component system response regulator HydG
VRRALLNDEDMHSFRSRIESFTEYSGIVGKDPKMQVIYKLIEEVAPTDASVLIQGETGTGKELVARAIHDKSARRAAPFVVINCSAYAATLLESELFGHERGAFTGAIRQKPGRFEQAKGGTVFLDEVSEVSPEAQVKLLRVLQTHTFERLGGEQTLSVDVRILAATNRDLLEEVEEGKFREDLYYRLNVIPLVLPPLRERRNDIALLANHFLQRFADEQGKEIKEFSSEALWVLLDHDWPGNVRELENTIEHATLLTKGTRLDVSDLPRQFHKSHSVSTNSFTSSLPTTIEGNEKQLLRQTLENCGWNKSSAAEVLGISRNTLYAKIRKYGIFRTTIH